jgi:hypothetical protein
MSHYYFKVVASPDGQWQTRRGARGLAAYPDLDQALTLARVQIDLHPTSELASSSGPANRRTCLSSAQQRSATTLNASESSDKEPQLCR